MGLTPGEQTNKHQNTIYLLAISAFHF